jgi:branched-chain amino acid transport system ATP-binding protein
VRQLVEHGKTVLLIEHNMELISELSDVVVFLHQGRVLAAGAPAAITRDPALTEIYFGV